MYHLIRTFVLTFIAVVNYVPLVAQNDSKGSGRALQFDGINDYVDLGNIYDDLDFPFTVSAWVKLEPGETGGPVFVSQNNQPIYNGFWFFVSPTSVAIEYGDGRGENQPAFRRGKSAAITNITGRWVHICAVIRGLSTIDLYVNGNLVSGSLAGGSSLPMASNYPGDVATIGHFLSNGTEYWFKGAIDNVQMYNKELSIDAIRNSMTKKLLGNESGLIGYWNFDEMSSTIVNDKSANHFNGVLKGGVGREFSGAPIGDENVFNYAIDGGSEVKLNDFGVYNFQNGIPSGVHIYHVLSSPSQTNGLTDIPVDYYGVFLADMSSGKTFVVKDGGLDCSLMKRVDNSEPNWTAFIAASTISDRSEFVQFAPGPPVDLELGPNLQLCNVESVTLNSFLPAQHQGTLRWSTGETTPSIVVNKNGSYAVAVGEGCNTTSDTVRVTFAKTPPAFSLGQDEKVCSVVPRKLQPLQDGDYAFEWQDGSHESSFVVNTFGKYWVTVKNTCGESKDSITIEQLVEAKLEILLGSDLYLCDEKSVTLNSFLGPEHQGKLLWSTGETASSIIVNKSGEYVLQVENICSIEKDTIRVSFLTAPPEFSLGDDESLCTVTPRTLHPVQNDGYSFEWQDGSREPSLIVNAFGTYKLTVKNSCGESSDSLTIRNLGETEYEIPNVFTPNGDASNQYFQVKPLVENSRLKVFNRWGRTVYEAGSYQNNWDGEGISDGKYYYTFTPACGQPQKGILSILR
jgi:gliding motility-associated-like protein